MSNGSNTKPTKKIKLDQLGLNDTTWNVWEWKYAHKKDPSLLRDVWIYINEEKKGFMSFMCTLREVLYFLLFSEDLAT